MSITDKEPPMLVDLSDRQARLNLLADINNRKGWHEISIKERKFNRTNKQNSFWWAAVVKPFHEYLRDEWGDPTITKEQAHDYLKLAILGPKEIKNAKGESMMLVPSSHDLNTLEFSVLVDKATVWLSENCEIEVIPAEIYLGAAI